MQLRPLQFHNIFLCRYHEFEMVKHMFLVQLIYSLLCAIFFRENYPIEFWKLKSDDSFI